MVGARHRFSKAISVVNLPSKYTTALTFENHG